MVARCRFSILGAFCAAAVLLVGAATPAGASITPLQWHRVDIYDDPPHHERWRCLTDGQWQCLFDNVPEPILGYSVSGVRVVFTGTEVPGSWECPSWFPGEICDSAVRVVAGTATGTLPRSAARLSSS